MTESTLERMIAIFDVSALDSTHYVYQGSCIPMVTRTDQWVAKPTAGG